MSDIKSMLGKLHGYWKLESSQKFDEYMKAVDVGFMMRKLGAAAKPNIRIADDGENIVIKTETTFTTHEIKFQPGVEFDETTSDGRKAKSTFDLADFKLVQKQGGEGIVPSTITRELKDDNTMICTCEAKDVVCTRVYNRIPE